MTAVIIIILVLVLGVPAIVLFAAAIGGASEIHKKKEAENAMESDALVECQHCKKQVRAKSAISLRYFLNIDGWVCNECSEKLFVNASSLSSYAIYHNNQIPDFDSPLYAKRREKVALVRQIIESDDWELIKYIHFNKKTMEIVSTIDPVLGSSTSLTSDTGFGEIIKIEEIVSIKINFNWGLTDSELRQLTTATNNRINMGKRMAISYELFGAPGLLYQASKNITGPESESRILDANITIFLKNGSSVNLFIDAPYNCDRGTKTFDEFINNCQFVIDFINRIYDENYRTSNDSKTNDLSQLVELKKLFDEGVITEEEFNQKKKQILKL